ncbi:MAG TPA: hypothetical protein DCO77_02220 [Nitrospiraceae bacterium]|nr:hypothetical protein [Nitrospiraceae bacterium]
MKQKRLFAIIGMVVVMSTACAATKKTGPQEIPRMTKEELKANLDGGSIVIIDVRIPKDYDNSDKKIRGAVRENPMDVRYWTAYPKDKTIVLYCA